MQTRGLFRGVPLLIDAISVSPRCSRHRPPSSRLHGFILAYQFDRLRHQRTARDRNFDFVLGYAGQLNLGQSAFYEHRRLCFDAARDQTRCTLLGRFCGRNDPGGNTGALLSLFAVRLRGHYLAIASLGFAVITYQILLNWISLTQGPLGIYAIPPPPPIALPGLPPG